MLEAFIARDRGFRKLTRGTHTKFSHRNRHAGTMTVATQSYFRSYSRFIVAWD